jgi:hypothetical protein
MKTQDLRARDLDLKWTAEAFWGRMGPHTDLTSVAV